MSKVYLYARVSTMKQNLEPQVEDLKKAYPEGILFEESITGTSMKNRVQLHKVLAKLRKGDKLVVWALDRLGRSNVDLAKIVREIEERGAYLQVLKQNIDTSDRDAMSLTMTRMFLGMLGVFAEFETNLRAERQALGIEKAKANGKFKGGVKNQNTRDRVLYALEKGLNEQAVIDYARCSRSTYYRIRKEIKQEIEDIKNRKQAKEMDFNVEKRTSQLLKVMGYMQGQKVD